MPRIDSHQHFWKFDPVRDGWITDNMEAIRADFLPEDLMELLTEHEIDGSVVVQVDQSLKETLWLLALAEKNNFIRGVVGWVDLRESAIEERLSYLRQHERLKGFRHIVQAEPSGFLLQKDFLRGVGLLSKFNYTYDLLLYPQQLQEALEFVDLFPDQRFIIDHLAKPVIRDGLIEPWKKNITAIAARPNVFCKVSGLVTEADWKNWNADQLQPYLEVALHAFGPTRLLYGSDWPVCLLAASYPEQLGVVTDFFSQLSPSEKQLIMGENAVQFYNL